MFKIFSKKIAVIAILLISFFGMNLEEGKAQCPTGYSFTNMVININGCLYGVPVCYKCAPTALDATIVDTIKTFTKLDSNCTPSPSITDSALVLAINEEVANRIYYSQLCEVRPCGQMPRTTMLFREYACWEMYRDNNGNVHYQACTSGAVCETLKSPCFNGTNIVWTILSRNWMNDDEPECEYPSGGNIPIPDEWDASSGCYRLGTSCDLIP